MLKEEEIKPLPPDVESGGCAEDDELSRDPNQKSCYQPVLQKVQPVMEKVQPIVSNISQLFEDDENEITMEQNENGELQEKTIFKVTPTSLGAAVCGMVVGTLFMGPFVGVILAGGASYASTRSDKLGDYTKTVGKKTYKGLRRGYLGSKEYIEAKLDSVRGSALVASPPVSPGTDC